MKKSAFALLRTFLLAALVPVLSLGLVACSPDDLGGVGNGDTPQDTTSVNSGAVDKDDQSSAETPDDGVGDTSDDVTSAIAVTGLVDKFGCTYADISGYANLNLLPVGSGNPVIGVELVMASAENNEGAVQSTSGSLIGNIFTVTFEGLSPATEYKYRSFVTYGGTTYYGDKYKTFTTKEVVNVTSPGEASDIKRTSAVLKATVRTEGIDTKKENVYVGLAWSTSVSDLCAGGRFESSKNFVSNIENGVYSVLLDNLSEGTTYYYASFTLAGDVYVFSSVKEFTTDVLRLETGAVDLGLSVKWAGCNVGAESPEEYGDYFAWGETTTKSSYSSSNSLTYDMPFSELMSRGIIGSDGNLTAAYDATTVNLGDNWRMPTLAEMKELINNCSWSWTTINGVNGRLVTGPNGNSIFLPAAGYRNHTSLFNAGSSGYYWSATPDSNSGYACYLNFYSDKYDRGYGDFRNLGHTVRPVSDK